MGALASEKMMRKRVRLVCLQEVSRGVATTEGNLGARPETLKTSSTRRNKVLVEESTEFKEETVT